MVPFSILELPLCHWPIRYCQTPPVANGTKIVSIFTASISLCKQKCREYSQFICVAVNYIFTRTRGSFECQLLEVIRPPTGNYCNGTHITHHLIRPLCDGKNYSSPNKHYIWIQIDIKDFWFNIDKGNIIIVEWIFLTVCHNQYITVITQGIKVKKLPTWYNIIIMFKDLLFTSF